MSGADYDHCALELFHEMQHTYQIIKPQDLAVHFLQVFYMLHGALGRLRCKLNKPALALLETGVLIKQFSFG